MITEKEIIEQLKKGEISLPPLVMRFIESDPVIDGNRLFDALVDLTWQDQQIRFALECKAASTPKIFRNALNQLKLITLPKNIHPLLLVPYLSDFQLQELEREKISGVDLCGNGIVIVPGRLSIFRSGQDNRFPSSALIKNIYRRNSSMVGRVFLAKPGFKSVQAICDEVNKRNIMVGAGVKKPMTLSTVSKALKILEDDLIIERADSINILQPLKLLERMVANYVSPRITDRVKLKVQTDRSGMATMLADISCELKIPVLGGGLSSVAQYAVMQRDDVLSVYCPSVKPVIDRIQGDRTNRFPNLELIETEEEPVYFDPLIKENFAWSSAIQVYLELMMGDSRDRETAEQVRTHIVVAAGRIEE